jgi:hypothetical protein
MDKQEKNLESDNRDCLESTYGVAQDEKSFNGWRLLETAQRWLSNYRVKICQRSIRRSQDVVKIVSKTNDAGTKNVYYKNLMRCESVWLCPFCMAEDARARHKILAERLEFITKASSRLYMLTLTCQHSRLDSLKSIFTKFFKARRTSRNRSTWKKIMQPIDGEMIVRSTEITHGENGWHVHTHEILATSEELTEQQIENIFLECRSASLDAGLKAPSRAAFDLHIVDASHGSSYVTKWGIEQEVIDPGVKHSRGNMTYIDLLKWTESGNIQARDLIREYAAATKGRQKMEFGRGWKELLGMENDVKSDEQEQEVSGVQGEIVLDSIDRYVWYQVVNAGQRHKVLVAYAQGGQRGGRALLTQIMNDSYAVKIE